MSVCLYVCVSVCVLADAINKTQPKDRHEKRKSLESEIVSQRGKCLIYVCFASDLLWDPMRSYTQRKSMVKIYQFYSTTTIK